MGGGGLHKLMCCWPVSQTSGFGKFNFASTMQERKWASSSRPGKGTRVSLEGIPIPGNGTWSPFRGLWGRRIVTCHFCTGPVKDSLLPWLVSYNRAGLRNAGIWNF